MLLLQFLALIAVVRGRLSSEKLLSVAQFGSIFGALSAFIMGWKAVRQQENSRLKATVTYLFGFVIATIFVWRDQEAKK